MEGFLVILGILVLAVPIATLVLIILHIRLRRDMRAVQSRISQLERMHERDGPVAPVHALPSDDSAPSAPVDAQTRPAALSNVVALPGTQDAAPQDPIAAAQVDAADDPTHAPAAEQGIPAKPANAGFMARAITWLKTNWFYAAAAMSLSLAGLFLVQYGIEQGLLSPALRVFTALGFGAALVGAGETIRRRWGQDSSSATAYLPAIASGAGIVTLMGAILSARLLYDFIGPETALILLALIAGCGMVLGWLHGPALAAIGLIGGMGAPFLVGGQSDAPHWMLAYFALVTSLGLGIDTVKRWAWISVLAVALGLLAGLVLWLPSADAALSVVLIAYAALVAILSILVPARGLTPDQAGRCVTQRLFGAPQPGPFFPTWLAFGSVLAASALIVLASTQSTAAWWVALVTFCALATLITLWSHRAHALQDVAALPALGALALVATPVIHQPVLTALTAVFEASQGLTEQRPGAQFTAILILFLVPALAAFWRGRQAGAFGTLWTAAAVTLPLLGGLALEILWHPATYLGHMLWAMHALAMAALMVVLAERSARHAPADKTKIALPTLSALAALTFALGLVFSHTALTLALTTTVVSSVLLDRRFNLPLMSVYVAAGCAGLLYRLVTDPGLGWALEAPLWAVALAYGGSFLGLFGAYHALRHTRANTRIVVESTLWSVSALALSVLLHRTITALVGISDGTSHWALGLHLCIWSTLTLAQLAQSRAPSPLRLMQYALAGLFGLISLGFALYSILLANPLLALAPQTVYGPVVINTLIPAYLLPAGVFAGAACVLGGRMRAVLWGISGVFGTLWLALALRHVFQGGTQMALQNGITQPELYAYTVALLLIGAGLFYQALARASDHLRGIGTLVIALAVAKVYLIDMSGLSGLVRVFSFLLLGLSLAGLAWFNRWVMLRAKAKPDGPSPK